MVAAARAKDSVAIVFAAVEQAFSIELVSKKHA